ncbi:hypothetical protein CR513_17337, partial [Mucuna pruriens]
MSTRGGEKDPTSPNDMNIPANHNSIRGQELARSATSEVVLKERATIREEHAMIGRRSELKLRVKALTASLETRNMDMETCYGIYTPSKPRPPDLQSLWFWGNYLKG